MCPPKEGRRRGHCVFPIKINVCFLTRKDDGIGHCVFPININVCFLTRKDDRIGHCVFILR